MSGSSARFTTTLAPRNQRVATMDDGRHKQKNSWGEERTAGPEHTHADRCAVTRRAAADAVARAGAVVHSPSEALLSSAISITKCTRQEPTHTPGKGAWNGLAACGGGAPSHGGRLQPQH
jgi:hypothetical protein